MNITMANDPQQQFGQGLGNGGDRPPYQKQPGDPQRGHYVEGLRPTDALTIFKDAGVKGHHTLCIACGQKANLSHRNQWRKCRGGCALNPTHHHPGQPCSDLMRVANEDWCFSHVRESLNAERDAARDLEHKERAEQRREQKANAPKPGSNRPPQQYGRPTSPQGHSQAPQIDHFQGYGQASTLPSRYPDSQRPTQGRLFGDYQNPGHDAGHPNSSYGAGYEVYSSRDVSADPRHVYDGKYSAQNGPIRKPDFRERSPPRESLPIHGSYRDRAPSTVRSTREPPSSESATERMAKMLAQRKAESGFPSARLARSPTQAQGAQSQVQPDLERRFQEQRLQAATTAIATLQKEAIAANTKYEQLKTAHLALIQQVYEVTHNAAVALSALAPRAHIATPAEPLRSKVQQPLPD